MQQAKIVLQDGYSLDGFAPYSGEVCAEIVFNTSMSGYQEILTDPSYAGQMVTMTYPLIGNYGVNEDDIESDHVHVRAFIIKELADYYSNYRATASLVDYLQKNNVVLLTGVDTRALTRHIRNAGAMKAIVSTEDLDTASLLAKLEAYPDMEGRNLAKEVTTPQSYVFPADGEAQFKVVAIDCGIKKNILRILSALHCEVHVFPLSASLEEIEAIEPDGVFISNGPGDPAAVLPVMTLIKSLMGKYPLFGICLGHQLMALALGAKTFKLKFGHRGANHPVLDRKEGRVDITSQNHGFCVDEESLQSLDVEVTHTNLNDQTVAGMAHKVYPVYSIQYHPEASPGPHDAKRLFKPFIDNMQYAEKGTVS